METEKAKALLIGSGFAGYTAGIYASGAGLNPALCQGRAAHFNSIEKA